MSQQRIMARRAILASNGGDSDDADRQMATIHPDNCACAICHSEGRGIWAGMTHKR